MSISKYYTYHCAVCGEKAISGPEVNDNGCCVCLECLENARQMLAIKNFAKEVNVKIDIGMVEKAEVKKIRALFGLEE